MKGYGIWIIIIYLLMNIINIHPTIAAIDNRGEILILHSYSPDYEWTQTEQSGIENFFKPLSNQYRMRIEYMDSGHSPTLLEGQQLKQLYKDKFSNSHFRAIIVSDNAAFNFLRQYRDELFPGVPVVFCGINGYEESMIQGLEGFTGIAEDNDFAGLFTMISKLHPNLQRIVIYGIPSDPSHIPNITLIKKILLDFHPNYQIEIREFPHLDACIEDGKELPPDSAILMVGSMQTAKGEGINLQRANEIMSASVQVPIYTAWDFGVNHGAIGGLVVSGANQGKLAAEMALRILEGQPLQDVAVSRYVGNVYMFDYNQLTRFGLQLADLPPDSLIINSPDTTYRINRQIIWAGILFLGFLTITVFILVRNIRQRKQAEEALQKAHDNLEFKIEERTHELLSLNEELIAMNEELQSTNGELENEITERRRMEVELSSSNQKLTEAIDKLQTMQAYLVESAKMASLGNLVAGVAHEINTPVGVGLTAASHLQELTKEFEYLCLHGTPRRQHLFDYLKELHESSTIILKNLERAGKLIQSFKQVSADQSSEIGRVFHIKKYLEEIILSMHPQLKNTNHRITLECDETLTMDGFPGALSQITTNLIMNSIIHAYNPGDKGNITLSVKLEGRTIILLYTDDGKGMDCNVLSKIFDPFYTTKRGYGGTGLGLYIVYNIVTQRFKGTIVCESQPDQGVIFRISLPFPKEELSNGVIR